MNEIQIINIADKINLLETIIPWHEKEWGSQWATQVSKSTNKDKIPTMYLALQNGLVVGTVLLLDYDLETRKDLSPWMGGVYVDTPYRGKGIGTQLVIHAMFQAKKMNIPKLWLYTEKSQKLYERLGWILVNKENYQTKEISIMSINLKT